MNRKWLLAFLLIYLSALALAVILVGSQNNYLRLTLPAGDALLLAGVIVGGAAGAVVISVSLFRQRKHLVIEKRRLEGITASQAAMIQAQEKTIASQVAAIHEQESVINEQQEFRRALNHELRNPITAISVGIESLSAECGAETVRRLKSDVERVSRLLDTVSALVRLEANPIEHLPVQLDVIVQQTVEMIQATSAARGCKLTVDLPAGPFPLPAVAGDEDLLFVALHNLLNNAVKFTPGNGEVVVRAFEDDASVVIQICDNGLGMSAEDVRQAGQPFRRGQVALDHKIPGSGLGLFQAYKIVARHRGKNSIHSEVGKGTVITLHLPIGAVTPE